MRYVISGGPQASDSDGKFIRENDRNRNFGTVESISLKQDFELGDRYVTVVCPIGSGIDLTSCMVDILESFNMSADSTDIGLPPDIDGHPVGNKSSRSESEIYGTDAGSAKTTLSSDSGLFDRHLDRNSIWRNSSSSSSSNQSSLSIASDRDAVDGPNGAAYNRLSSLSTGSKTHFIMEEIIQTESSYIEDLKQICQVRPFFPEDYFS